MVSFDPGFKRKELGGQLLWFLMWFGVTAIALWLTPDPHGHGTHRQLGFPPCPSVMLYGRLCPSCGMTTSFTSFVHGQWDHAFRANPFGPFAYIMFSVSAWACLYGWFKGMRFNTNSRRFTYSLLTFFLIFVSWSVVRFMFEPVGLKSVFPDVERQASK